MPPQVLTRINSGRAFVPGIGWRPDGAGHSPRQNHLLAALPAMDYVRLLSDLEPVTLPLGWTIHAASDPEPYLYFITSGIVARFYLMENGAPAGFSITGHEGVIGVAAFLGGEGTPSQAVVQCAGSAFRMRASRINREFGSVGALAQLLLRYTQALVTQFGQTAVCNRHHQVEQQLCRLVLACLDRLPSDEVTMTQELMADILGVRREAVTQAAGKLEDAGLLRRSRGKLTALDRAGLEARACECYAVVKHEMDRLLPAANA